jgi:hypothetical protein
MKTEMLKVLISPLTYLQIRHEAKRWADWFYPLFFTALSTYLILKYGRPGAIGGQEGLLAKLLVVSSVLPGFYIAALAAIATFNRADIDDLMPAPTPTIVHRIGGQKNTIELTRRRFLTHLFAFLCFESLAVMVTCMFASIVGASILGNFIEPAAYGLKVGFLFLLLLLFWQMLFGTLLGLYYLGDRLFRSY